MDYQDIQRLILSNEKEIAELEKNGTPENMEAVSFLKGQQQKIRELLDKLQKAGNEIDQIEKDTAMKKDDKKKKIKAIKKSIGDSRQEIVDLSQGKIHDLFSSFIGQIDKRLHNFIYNHDNKISKALYRWSSKRFDARYDHPYKYLLKNGALTLAVTGGMILLGELIPVLGVLTAPVVLGNMGFFGISVIKGISAIYSGIKFGKVPKFPREMTIKKGSYLENIKTSRYILRKQRNFNMLKIEKPSVSQVIPKTESHDDPQKQLMNDRIISEFRSFDIASADLNRLIIMYAKLQPVKDNLPIELKDKYNKLYLEYMKKKKEYESAKTTLEELDKIDIDAITAKDIDKINELITKCQKYFSYATDDQKKKLIALTSKRNILVNSHQPVQKDGSKLSDEVKVYFEKLEKLDINTLTIQNLKDMNELISDYQKKYHSFATEEQTKKYNALLEKRRALTAVQRRAYEDDKIKKLRDLLISITVDDVKDTVSKMGMIQSLSRVARKNCYVNLIALKKIFSLSEEVIDFIHDPILLKKLKEILSVTSKEQIEKMSAILPKRVNIHYYEENSTATLQFYGSNSQRPLFEINISDMSVEKVEEAVRIVGFDGDIYITKHSSVRKK